nr:Gp49 family protein [Moraxella sp. CTOTU46711]
MKNHGYKLGVISAMALAAALPERKLTKDFLESEIGNVEYVRIGEKTTHCTITTKSGFTFTGESACVDPNNFDQKIGEKFAYEQAFEKMWMPYGFWLHKALADHDNRLQPPSDDNKIEAQDWMIPDDATFSFGDAVEILKKGARVAREGWNGKGMFLYYVPENKYPASRNEHGTMVGVFEDDMVPYGAYIAMKTAQNNVVPWLASQTDVLAEDWQIVE